MTRTGREMVVTSEAEEANEATSLAIAQCSIAATRRRRFQWAAWWTTPPCRQPFVKPDAHGGGARSFEQARADAEKTLGRSITLIPPHWARAWARVMQGQRPWPRTSSTPANTTQPDPPPPSAPSAAAAAAAMNWGPSAPWWQVLGVERGSTVVEARRAYRRLVLVHHPDRGGNADTFRRIHLAYQQACRPPARRRS